MQLIGGLLIGCCIGFFVGAGLMREKIKENLNLALPRSAWIHVAAAFRRGAA